MKADIKVQTRYHLIFWGVYIVLWSARDLIYHQDLVGNILLNVIFNLSVVPFIYFNLYYLVPDYLLKRKWGWYALLFSIGFLLILGSRYYTYQYVFEKIGALDAASRFSGWDGVVILGSENVILIMMTMSLFLIQKYHVKEQYARELEQKNVESELNMLKSQLQPHFLFNNLNTIYFLMENNPSLAKEVMVQFSDVLSHQLYNAKKDKVPLKEELDSLENFLKLQKVRHQDFLDLQYVFPENAGTLQVAPMILLTFIENAFKHGSREEGYKINIKVVLQGNDLHLYVSNPNGTQNGEKNGGLGLENVRRRLSLLYPNKHSLECVMTGDTYTVYLTLTLESHGQT